MRNTSFDLILDLDTSQWRLFSLNEGIRDDERFMSHLNLRKLELEALTYIIDKVGHSPSVVLAHSLFLVYKTLA